MLWLSLECLPLVSATSLQQAGEGAESAPSRDGLLGNLPAHSAQHVQGGLVHLAYFTVSSLPRSNGHCGYAFLSADAQDERAVK